MSHVGPDETSPPATAPDVAARRRRRWRVWSAMLWSALWLAPVLYLVELTGPQWLNLTLRGLWLGLAIVTVLAGIGLWVTQRSTRARR